MIDAQSSDGATLSLYTLQQLVFTIKMADHYGNHRCHIEKNVPVAFILSSRLQDGAESVGIETTSCL